MFVAGSGSWGKKALVSSRLVVRWTSSSRCALQSFWLEPQRTWNTWRWTINKPFRYFCSVTKRVFSIKLTETVQVQRPRGGEEKKEKHHAATGVIFHDANEVKSHEWWKQSEGCHRKLTGAPRGLTIHPSMLPASTCGRWQGRGLIHGALLSPTVIGQGRGQGTCCRAPVACIIIGDAWPGLSPHCRVLRLDFIGWLPTSPSPVV